ncbi:MAG: DUF167 domain-containing protein [Chloroflexi bacterium]|nr:DUF167 domain-containing protein [Chloroflexota bacterium]MDA1298313.1 DUF167 domain-containing protein [Chloroflexota bacterium]
MALLNVRVQPRASRSEVGGLSEDGVLRVRVTSPPSDGEANDAMLKLLAKHLGVARGVLTIVRGESSRNKVIEVAGLTDAELKQRL